MSIEFWIGLFIGAMGGTCFGGLIFAILTMGKDDVIVEREVENIVDLNHEAVTLQPGDPGYVADRFYREQGNPDDRRYRR